MGQARKGHPGTATDGLEEPRALPRHPRPALHDRSGPAWDTYRAGSQPHGGRAEKPTGAGVGGLDDAAVLDLDPGTQLVGLTETVLAEPAVQIAQAARRSPVIVGHGQRERDPGYPLDRAGGDPGDSGDGS